MPVGCVPPALYRTGGGLPDRDHPVDRDPLWTDTPCGQRPPVDRDPWIETPCGQRPPVDKDPPGQRPPGQRSSWTETKTPPLWTDKHL